MHCHSTWSADGKASIEEMAAAAAARGYEYLCLTDHSHYLREGRIEEQWREIEAVNARSKPFRVLRGIEANITAKGEVDVADEHAGGARLGGRVAAHLARPHSDRACAGRHGQPARGLHRASDGTKDLATRPARSSISTASSVAPSRRARASRSTASPTDSTCAPRMRASPRAAGVAIPVNTDAHSVKALGYAELGIGQARRGWLTKEQVLNTRSWAAIAKARG